MEITSLNLNFEDLSRMKVDFIENHIKKLGFEPLRWAIVKIDGQKFTVDAVVIKNNNGKPA